MSLTKYSQQSEQIRLWDFVDITANHVHKHEIAGKNVNSKITGMSLFTGAGGMDVGFSSAGIKVIIANELSQYACDTYEANHPETMMLRGDIKDYLDILGNNSADIVFGGPPCQGFSVAGKMNPEDERSQLIWTFLEVVERVRPHVFIMENVKALGALEKWKYVRKKFIEKASNIGYCCNFYILNAADFEVSQNRERVFFIGSCKPYNSIAFEKVLSSLKEKPKSLRQLFRSLPPAGSKDNPLTCTAKISLAVNPVMRKSPYAGMLFNGMGRPLNLEAVSTTLPASMGGNKTPIIDCMLLENPSSYDWISDYHAKLRNGTGKAQFSPAPEHLRRLTIVESAAIQSFPTDYIFCGSKSAIYSQIGNAVPCKLAQRIAEAVIRFFY
jgi:DNA (cytosine-5)-methyltransferase 1